MMKTSLEIKFVPKGWGFEKWIVNNENAVGNFFICKRKNALAIIN